MIGMSSNPETVSVILIVLNMVTVVMITTQTTPRYNYSRIRFIVSSMTVRARHSGKAALQAILTRLTDRGVQAFPNTNSAILRQA